jgi:hypothetical protein
MVLFFFFRFYDIQRKRIIDNANEWVGLADTSERIPTDALPTYKLL